MIFSPKLNIVEMYAGTARSAEAFRKWKKANISLLIDNNDIAAKTYKGNYPDAPYLTGDLTKINSRDIQRLVKGKVDILLGCPPCQGFSAAGQRNPNDTRNQHLTLYAKYIVALKPMAVSMENVPLAVDSDLFRNFTKILEEAGYKWTAGILNAALRGSTQSRQRLLLIAFRQDIGIQPIIPKPLFGGTRKYYSYSHKTLTTMEKDRIGILGETPATTRLKNSMTYIDDKIGNKDIPTIGDLFDDLPLVGSKKAKEMDHNLWAHSPEAIMRMSNVPEGGQWTNEKEYFASAYGRLHRKGLSRTITTCFPNAGSGRFWHPTEERAISIREAARIQGFPDSFKFFSPSRAIAQLVGNALDASIAEVAYNVIRKALD